MGSAFYHSNEKEFDQDFNLITKLERELDEGQWDSFSPEDDQLKKLLELADIPKDKHEAVAKEIGDMIFVKDLPLTFKSYMTSVIKKAKIIYDQNCADRYMRIFRSRQAGIMETIEENLKTGLKIIIFLESHQLLDGELYQFLQTKRCVALSSNTIPPFFEDMKSLWEKKSFLKQSFLNHQRNIPTTIPFLLPVLKFHRARLKAPE